MPSHISCTTCAQDLRSFSVVMGLGADTKKLEFRRRLVGPLIFTRLHHGTNWTADSHCHVYLYSGRKGNRPKVNIVCTTSMGTSRADCFSVPFFGLASIWKIACYHSYICLFFPPRLVYQRMLRLLYSSQAVTAQLTNEASTLCRKNEKFVCAGLEILSCRFDFSIVFSIGLKKTLSNSPAFSPK